MENLLNRTRAFFDEKGAGNTAQEIAQQGETWRKLALYLEKHSAMINKFMEKIESVQGLRIVFTGAGSSAFIAESMQMMLAAELRLRSEAVHTTDIVSSPDSTLFDVPTLMVSYSRSGESPESTGTLQYAAARIRNLYNLVLVCKEDSSMARYAVSVSDTLVLNMPPESCDLGFAMTCSISTMALATWCVFGWREMSARVDFVRKLANSADSEINSIDGKAQQIALWNFDRASYLGSGALRGLAREGAVKMLELTSGAVNAVWDTSAGFRHGPKSLINDKTVTIHLLSPLSFTRQYDDDFLLEVQKQKKGNKIIAVAPSFDGIHGSDAEIAYTNSGNSEVVAYIKGLLAVQLLAFEKSLAQGITTDNPCAGGEVNRVVKGIRIYPLIV